MKSFVRVFIPAIVGQPGSSHEYVVDDAESTYGEVAAAAITGAVDVRADPEGRLAELRRALGQLGRTAARSTRKPTGGKTPGGRVQYFATSRLTGRQARVEVRHYTGTDVAANSDEPGN